MEEHSAEYEHEHTSHIKTRDRWIFSVVFIIMGLIVIRPFVVKQLHNKASSYLTNGSYSEAIRQYKKILLINKGDTEAWNWMAFTYHYSGDSEKAVETYMKALEIDPNNRIANYRVGMSFALKKQYNEAIPYFEQVKKIGPDSQREIAIHSLSYHKLALDVLAICYERLNDIDKAIMVLEEMRGYYPEDKKIESKLKYLRELKS